MIVQVWQQPTGLKIRWLSKLWCNHLKYYIVVLYIVNCGYKDGVIIWKSSYVKGKSLDLKRYMWYETVYEV